MCVVSAVFDQYKPYFPQQWPPPQRPFAPQQPPIIDANELRELIDSFKKAVDAAKVFDRLTGQPHCEDPEKAKLEERVAELERRLDEISTPKED